MSLPLSIAVSMPDAKILELVGIYVVSLVLSTAVHEYFHAWAAHRLGDDTAEREGRLTLNPVSHADPVGTLMMPIIAALFHFPLLGWGRPVPTSPRNYRRNVSMRGGLALVALAGPFGNLVLSVIVVALAFGLSLAGVLSASISSVLRLFVELNLLLMVFNLLPLHPLDGGKILAAFLPPKLEHIDEFLMRYGGYILIGLIVVGGSFLSVLLGPFEWLTDVAWSQMKVNP